MEQESGYTKHMAGHATSMMTGRTQSYNGCTTNADRYPIFSDVDSLYLDRRRHSMLEPGADMKKSARLFRPAAMSTDMGELQADLTGMSAAGRYGSLFSASPAVGDSTPYGKFGRQKPVVGSGSLVDALNDASSPVSGGNRSDCGDAVASSPLAVNGATGALGGGSSLFPGSFSYDVDDVGIYRRSVPRAALNDGAAFRPPVGYPFSQSYLNHSNHHQADSSSFVFRQSADHQTSLLSHQQHQPPQNGSIFYGHGSGLTDTDGATAGRRDLSPAVDSRARRYFSPAAGYFGTTSASGAVMPSTYGGAESAATRYDGALGSLNSYLQRGGAFTSPGVASALEHLARSLPAFR